MNVKDYLSSLSSKNAKQVAMALSGLKGQAAKEKAETEFMKWEVAQIEKAIAYMEEMEATYSNVIAFPV